MKITMQDLVGTHSIQQEQEQAPLTEQDKNEIREAWTLGSCIVTMIHASTNLLNSCSKFGEHPFYKKELAQKCAQIELQLREEGKARQIKYDEWTRLYIHTKRELLEQRVKGSWEGWARGEGYRPMLARIKINLDTPEHQKVLRIVTI